MQNFRDYLETKRIVETVTKKTEKFTFFKNQNSFEYVIFSSPF